MELNEEMVEKLVREELEKFLESNPQFAKMMRSQATNDAFKAAGSQPDNQAAKDKSYRQSQRGQGGTREIEFEQKDVPAKKKPSFPKTTPPKTSGTSSFLIAQNSKKVKDGKGSK